jgi:mono/diheme cytochrome c family protein
MARRSIRCCIGPGRSFTVLLLAAGAAFAQGDPVAGKELFKTCAGCHNVDNDRRKMGPPLRTLFGKVTLVNGKHADEANVRALVLNGYNQMPPFRDYLTSEQMDDLMAYLVTLNGKIPAKPAQGADAAFRTWCINCHDPRRNGDRGPDLRGLYKRTKLTEPDVRRMIDDGHGDAPPLKAWLDEPSRAAILNYLKTY